MKSVLALLCLCLVTAASAISFFDVVKEEWIAFKMEHGKEFENDLEDELRMKIYVENKYQIAKHNQRFHQGLATFTMKPNKYSDMLHHEFVHTMNGVNATARHNMTLHGKSSTHAPLSLSAVQVSSYPSQFDWREKGAVTGVKDQGGCGSCWAFSSTGSLEGQHFLKSGNLVSLSEQNLVDCSSAYGNHGCSGGFMTNAFNYVKDNKGIDTESSYPYEAKNDNCRYNSVNSGADDVGYAFLPQGDEQKLLEGVATIGPISVAIDAGQSSFQFYSGGVYYDEKCSSTSVDHGVLVVGYGTDAKGGDYWLVKNSWGTGWGENGYIKMARNRNNACAIALYPCYPLV